MYIECSSLSGSEETQKRDTTQEITIPIAKILSKLLAKSPFKRVCVWEVASTAPVIKDGAADEK